MARARNIKPAFFTNELLGTEDPMVCLTFMGLWCLADKVGILEDRPLRIRAELFPYRESLDVNGYLSVLARLGFIVRYENSGRRLIQVSNFRKHQSPHHTEKAKGYPFSTDPKSLITEGNGYRTVQQPDNDGESKVAERPDSLIPDSLIPDTGLTDSLIPDSKTIRTKTEKAERTKTLKANDLIAMGVQEQHAKDWLAIRKQKRAPLTQTAMDGVLREVQAAGITVAEAVRISAERGWQGFKAGWLQNKPAFGQPVNRQQQVEDNNAKVVQAILQREQLKSGPQDLDLDDPVIINGEVINVD